MASSGLIDLDIPNCLCKINGVDYPAIGFGTYPLTDEACEVAVKQAAKIGYRIIDTATYYGNFGAIAKGIKEEGREHFYLISKVWHDRVSPGDLRKDLEKTLEMLKTDYLDAYLLHFPNSKISIEETLNAVNELRQAKKIRHIGLSNISVNHLKRALEVGVPIQWVQVEMHPCFYDSELLKFCHEHSIGLQAWAPLGRGRISQDAVLGRMGEKYGKTASQIAIRWIIQHGCIPLPGSSNEKHMSENIRVNDFMLTVDEMSAIDERAKLGERERFTMVKIGFEDEFDFSYEECWPKNQ